MSNDECRKLTKNEWKKWTAITGRVLLAYALIFVQGAWAAQNQGTKDKADSPQKGAAQQTGEKMSSLAASAKALSKQTQAEESESSAAEEKPSGDASHQGIKVHGHWTIEVRNPDGALVTHREFENSLVQSPALALFLARQSSVGLWNILLSGNVSTFFLVLFEPGYNTVEFNQNCNCLFSTLSVSASGNSVVFSGTGTAPNNDAINKVSTFVLSCPSSFALPPTSPCHLAGAAVPRYNLTATDSNSAIAVSPIPVSTGQTVAVTVVLSFS